MRKDSTQAEIRSEGRGSLLQGVGSPVQIWVQQGTRAQKPAWETDIWSLKTLETKYDLVTLCASVIQLKESKPVHVQKKVRGM